MIKTKNCAIFGGTFDPIHLGHLRVIDKLLDSKEFELIIIVPTGIPALRKAEVTPEDRFAMAKLAVGNRKVLVSEIEVKRPETSYAIDTVRELQKIYPEYKLHWVLGADAFAGLEKWHEIEDLQHLVEFLVIDRPGATSKASKFRARHWNVDALPISATEIRDTLKSGGNVEKLIPNSVMEYIKQNGFYGAA